MVLFEVRFRASWGSRLGVFLLFGPGFKPGHEIGDTHDGRVAEVQRSEGDERKKNVRDR
jgi:hypothetical protein